MKQISAGTCPVPHVLHLVLQESLLWMLLLVRGDNFFLRISLCVILDDQSTLLGLQFPLKCVQRTARTNIVPSAYKQQFQYDLRFSLL
jgi:hypothetical protein